MRKLVIRDIVENFFVDVYQNDELIGTLHNALQLNDIRCQIKKHQLENVTLKWTEDGKEIIANINKRGRIIDNHPPLNTYEDQLDYLIDLGLQYDELDNL